MPQAIVDPEQVRRFAQLLRRFSEELERQMHLIQNQLHNLGSTWRDQEHRKFAEEFQQQVVALSKFTESTQEYARFLLRKAQRAEEYLRQR